MEFLPGCRISDRFVVGVKKVHKKKLENICKIGYLETGGRNGGLHAGRHHTDVGMEKT